MGFFRSLMIILGVFFSCLALLVPFLAVDVPLAREAWLFQTIGELHREFRLVPTLNGVPLDGPNVLMPVIFSLLPFSDVLSLRLADILLGCLVAMGVFSFCTSLWDSRSGILASLITITSWGFIASHATLNPTALPASLAILAFLLFAQVYIKEYNSWWYVLSYLLAGAAVIVGGWIPLGFFAFGVVLLILFDLSPKRILTIRAVSGVLIIGGMILAAFIAYWIAAGWSYAGSIFTFDSEHGLVERLWIWMKYHLPWLFLVIPAWAYGGRPQGPNSWRSLLAPKTGFGMGLMIVLFSPNLQEGYALLGVPFGGIIVGYWAAGRLLIPERLQALRTAAVITTGALLTVAVFLYLSVESIRELSLSPAQAFALIALLAAFAIFLWLARKRQAQAVVGLCMVLMFCFSWYAAAVMLPARASGPVGYVRQISTAVPLLVYQDDLVMRGYLGYTGGRPSVVSKEVVPIGDAAYLAVRTQDLDAELDRLSRRMQAEVVSSFDRRETYALIRISPFFTGK
ncbi:MAG: hypothetical protein WBL38_09725 [Desulfomonilia bacterium]|nr:hypothetical protein [Deltaproteobacteria bacterium]HQQ14114.1 hypothetical protein [Deltaproteobacteria bacterium]